MHAAETNLLRLLQGSKVFLVPNFQRRYAWRKAEWEQLGTTSCASAGGRMTQKLSR